MAKETANVSQQGGHADQLDIQQFAVDAPAPFERFCLVLAQIPAGRVCSYGRVAELAELGNARQTCRWLRQLPRHSQLPWFRVVSASGKLADFANNTQQRRLLEAEGITFSASHRIPKKFYW